PDGTKLVVLCYRTESVEGKMVKKGPGGKSDPRKGANNKRVQVSVWDVASRKELGHPVETVTTEQGWYTPTYALSENGRFVLKTEVVQSRPGDPETGPTPGTVRLTVIDALTGAAGKPVEPKGPHVGRTSNTEALSPDGTTIAVMMDALGRKDVR